ncbi:Glucose-1-phosphate cytidylyltransferase [Tumidithrix helvetica PCC 7403]|uniref:glucose-1-phosphate cytidylyltransferase n=1 Tax=Tumidithrix helvetica TaxID=3457545 RepID=UPI003CA9B75E
MKAVILAGGLGTRLSEETYLKPKPMIEIGGRPILWHIMKIYSAYGITEFIVCCGYKGYVIKEYFANYFLHMSDVTFDMQSNQMEVHQRHAEPWRVTLVDTGEQTLTGGRLKRVQSYVGQEAFCFTYGDGVSNVNIRELISFHKEKKCLATVTAVQPPGRYGNLNIEQGLVLNFQEKPQGDGGWINGGYFVLEPEVFDLLEGDKTSWEDSLPLIASNHKLSAFNHYGFWQAMDTLRDKNYLESLWNAESAPWKVW